MGREHIHNWKPEAKEMLSEAGWQDIEESFFEGKKVTYVKRKPLEGPLFAAPPRLSAGPMDCRFSE